VTATVNLATERAHVDVGPGVDPDRLVAEVEAVGYTARLAGPGSSGLPAGAADRTAVPDPTGAPAAAAGSRRSASASAAP
jgi:Cu+-exporting ATPase